MTQNPAPTTTRELGARTFDPDLSETTVEIDDHSVDVYKLGGGTLGNSYEGFWGYRLRRGDTVIAAGGDLHTGMPKTHAEAAQLVVEIFVIDE